MNSGDSFCVIFPMDHVFLFLCTFYFIFSWRLDIWKIVTSLSVSRLALCWGIPLPISWTYLSLGINLRRMLQMFMNIFLNTCLAWTWTGFSNSPVYTGRRAYPFFLGPLYCFTQSSLCWVTCSCPRQMAAGWHSLGRHKWVLMNGRICCPYTR